MSILTVYLFLALGFYLFYTGKYTNYEDLYMLFLCFTTAKVITNYRACSVAYAECKLRGVKRENGFMNRFLDPIIDVRYSDHIYVVVPLTLMVMYHYFIHLGKLRQFHQKVFNQFTFG